MSYSVYLKNLSQDENNVVVVLPVPPSTPYQTVSDERVFNDGYSKSSDLKFGNQVVFWQKVLAKGGEAHYEETFEIIVSSRKFSINPTWSLSDYTRLKDNPEYSLYLETDRYLNGNDETVHRLAHSIAGRDETLLSVVRKFYEHVIKNLKYGNPIKGLYSFREALNKKTVDCGGFSSLLGSLCKAVGIPSRIVAGFWADRSYQNRGGVEPGGLEVSKKMHAWLEILLPDNQWFPLDPSVEHLRRDGRSSREGGFGIVGSDRLAFSYGSDIPLKVAHHDLVLDIFQNPVIIADKGINSVEVKTNFVVRKV